MNKKENRITARQATEKAVIRDEQNRRIQFAATNPIQEVLKNLHTTLSGLDEDAVSESRSKYGSNKVTHEKKQSLAKRLVGAFVNPFTVILFCLALVSAMTDMVFPYFSLLDSVPEDFDPLTVIIILTMVLISGTLRFVQESRSGNAAENLLVIPFDFTRRRLTTVVQDKKGKTQMVTKGAVEEMLSICSYAECGGTVQPLTAEIRKRILDTVDDLNDKGFRVLAIAQKSNPSPVGAFGVKDECEMVLLGYLAFLDPPKESTADAIKALKAHGVNTKILTGDNDKVTRTICKQVGLKVRNMRLAPIWTR